MCTFQVAAGCFGVTAFESAAVATDDARIIRNEDQSRRYRRGPPMSSLGVLAEHARYGDVPALYYLSGLTCTEETFPIKGHAPQVAAQLR
jgi:hypothetical protein